MTSLSVLPKVTGSMPGSRRASQFRVKLGMRRPPTTAMTFGSAASSRRFSAARAGAEERGGDAGRGVERVAAAGRIERREIAALRHGLLGAAQFNVVPSQTQPVVVTRSFA